MRRVHKAVRINWKARHARDKSLRAKYGITSSDYDDMLKRQRGRCAICGRPPKKIKLAVDHNHKTKQVRGLLCFRCNYGLPWFSSDDRILAKAAAYIWRSKNATNKHS